MLRRTQKTAFRIGYADGSDEGLAGSIPLVNQVVDTVAVRRRDRWLLAIFVGVDAMLFKELVQSLPGHPCLIRRTRDIAIVFAQQGDEIIVLGTVQCLRAGA